MADAEIEIDDESLVTVEAEEAPIDPADVVIEPKRTREAVKNAATEAAAALTQAVKTATAEADNARRAAEATALAERQRAEAAQREAQGYREKAEGHELTLLNSGIEKATNDVASAQTELEHALEAGEFAKASAAQVKLAKSSAALDRLEASKTDYESGVRRTPTTEGRVEAQPVVQDQFEQYLGQMAPRAQSWLRAHRECAPSAIGGSPVKNAAMMKGHFAALEEGIPEGSDAYFQKIEESVGYRQPVVTTTQQGGPVSQAAEVIEAGSGPAPKPRQQQRQAQPSAPVTREPPASNGSQQQPRSVRLTPEQQEVALLATSPREVIGADGRVVREDDASYRKRAFGQYARELIAATAEGKIGRLTH